MSPPAETRNEPIPARVRIPAADSTAQPFTWPAGLDKRVHPHGLRHTHPVEDGCQVLGRYPADKYDLNAWSDVPRDARRLVCTSLATSGMYVAALRTTAARGRLKEQNGSNSQLRSSQARVEEHIASRYQRHDARRRRIEVRLRLVKRVVLWLAYVSWMRRLHRARIGFGMDGGYAGGVYSLRIRRGGGGDWARAGPS
jgi:hypothetical protein